MDVSATEDNRIKLLYVEDDKGTQKMVVSMLRAKFPQMDLEIAQNGEEGVEAFLSHHPDIILTDIMMPVKDGIQMAREIKAMDKGTQIIVLTAAADRDFILDAIESGINHYVMKPIVMGKLVASVRRCSEEVLLRRQVRLQEESIRRMAYYDPLTGLPNRLLFNELLHQALAQAQRQGWHLAVLYLDLDRFKTVNDTLGHAVGDELLQAAAQRLKECCRRDQDVVARRGGDEFVILLSDFDSTGEAVRVAQKILDAFARPMALAEHEVFISPSIGISLFPDDGTTEDELIKHADVAMYSAKEEGRNRYHLFNQSMNEQSRRRLSLETGVRAALQKEEFFLQYQPNVDVKSGRVVSIEALLRWQHPELGLVPPREFIPLAEESGMIAAVTEWVVRKACTQNKKWQDGGFPPMRVAVNISPRQFQSMHFAQMVQEILSETGLDPHWLELEVTEGVMLQDVETTDATMRRLNDIGVQITIDNFGTGFTSFSYIRKLPIRTVKIDRSLVSDVTVDTDDAAVATAVITMAHTLGLNVVAQGVEAQDQLAFLSSHDCPGMQGYLFTEPLMPEEVSRLLASDSWKERISGRKDQ
ncbi:EAL domain-containing protein [Geomonas sp. RF6]|uniref:two-component system response regulator n=1 Tax=Geomonas sp. RF6 TaxID=2897342 RepID=UPI001E47DD21|nr:EAL domain-containing protein [Geomonas sp. RF6]UFS70357.1 EAL domain-containing protein [Geomonas sp. RF6]